MFWMWEMAQKRKTGSQQRIKTAPRSGFVHQGMRVNLSSLNSGGNGLLNWLFGGFLREPMCVFTRWQLRDFVERRPLPQAWSDQKRPRQPTQHEISGCFFESARVWWRCLLSLVIVSFYFGPLDSWPARIDSLWAPVSKQKVIGVCVCVCCAIEPETTQEEWIRSQPQPLCPFKPVFRPGKNWRSAFPPVCTLNLEPLFGPHRNQLGFSHRLSQANPFYRVEGAVL